MSQSVRSLSAKFSAAIRPKGSTPLPTGVVTALFFSMFGNALAMQMLFAFLPDMVKSFGIADEDAGYYVGMVSSAVFFGRFISSYLWGWLSDQIGRRKVLLICNGLLAIFTLAFGFAKSFKTALIIRFLTGLGAGVVGTVKASLAEVCDDSNQALGMSVVVTSWNTGLIVGPAIGGYLAKPAEKYPVFEGSSFFQSFAYLLPCLVNSALNVLSVFLVFFLLPETLASTSEKKEKEILSESVIKNEVDIPSSLTSSNTQSSSLKNNISHNDSAYVLRDLKHQDESSLSKSFETKLIPGSVSILPELCLENYPKSTEIVEESKQTPYALSAGKGKPGVIRRTYNSFKQSKLAKLCRNKHVRYTVSTYAVFSFAVMAEHEIYSLWAATGREFGGLGFDTNDLGFTLMVPGIICAVSNFIVFPRMVECFGLMKTQFITLIIMMFFVTVLPATNVLYDRGVILQATIILILSVIRVSQGCCFTGQFLMIGNCVTSSLRATAHGFSVSAVCAARTISPTVAGSLFSWSITSGLGFPFNEKCVFIFIGFVSWLSLVLACVLDEDAVTKRSE